MGGQESKYNCHEEQSLKESSQMIQPEKKHIFY